NKITFHCIDAEKFDYKKGRYGIVFCTNLFHLLSKEKMRRILKKILYSLRYRDGVLVAQYRDKNEITVRDFNDFFVITSNVKIHGDDGKLYRRFVATHANPFQRIQNSIRSVFIKEFPKRKRLHGKF
ncbi:MAG: class I SAM-dependent methyltransferase, partial [Deltaproteobacteria bacterium]|nr:class I SAM-dependent methyltransferase [Deltaproteobacteria bacterium]